MTQQVSRLNLTASGFPFLSNGIGSSSILSSQLDVTPSRVGGQQEVQMKPQLIYAENLLPTTEGYRSCVFTEIIAAANNPASTSFGEVYNVAASDGVLGWFAPAGGSNQLWKASTNLWAGTGTYGAGVKTSHANITGQSYICWALNQVKRINITAGTVSRNSDAGDTLVGITEANIKCICASGNYLIAAGVQTISWSSPTNPMDFTPSLVTGAGTATPSDLKGQIVAVQQTADGFLIYTTQNVVSATASGNATYPWIFKHVPGSTGIRSSDDAVSDEIDHSNTAWTIDGFQQVQASGVEPILPDLTDFIAARLMESYNLSTGILTITELTAELAIAIHKISKRYICISYGVTTFTHALIYDLALKRWGKVAITHVEIIALPSTSATAARELCFVAANGSTQQLSMSAVSTTATGVAIIGRIAVTRTSLPTMQGVTVESPKTTDTMVCRLGTSYKDGVTQDAIKTLVADANFTSTGKSRHYPCKATGVAHFLHLTGMLNLSNLVITTTQDGFR